MQTRVASSAATGIGMIPIVAKVRARSQCTCRSGCLPTGRPTARLKAAWQGLLPSFLFFLPYLVDREDLEFGRNEMTNVPLKAPRRMFLIMLCMPLLVICMLRVETHP